MDLLTEAAAAATAGSVLRRRVLPAALLGVGFFLLGMTIANFAREPAMARTALPPPPPPADPPGPAGNVFRLPIVKFDKGHPLGWIEAEISGEWFQVNQEDDGGGSSGSPRKPSDEEPSENQGLMKLKEPVIRYFGQEGGEAGKAVATSRRGFIDTREKGLTMVRMEEGVVVKLLDAGAEPIELLTNTLTYDSKTGAIATVEPVEIRWKSLLIKGRGLVGDLATDRIEIREEIFVQSDDADFGALFLPGSTTAGAPAGGGAGAARPRRIQAKGGGPLILENLVPRKKARESGEPEEGAKEAEKEPGSPGGTPEKGEAAGTAPKAGEDPLWANGPPEADQRIILLSKNRRPGWDEVPGGRAWIGVLNPDVKVQASNPVQPLEFSIVAHRFDLYLAPKKSEAAKLPAEVPEAAGPPLPASPTGAQTPGGKDLRLFVATGDVYGQHGEVEFSGGRARYEPRSRGAILEADGQEPMVKAELKDPGRTVHARRISYAPAPEGSADPATLLFEKEVDGEMGPSRAAAEPLKDPAHPKARAPTGDFLLFGGETPLSGTYHFTCSRMEVKLVEAPAGAADPAAGVRAGAAAGSLGQASTVSKVTLGPLDPRTWPGVSETVTITDEGGGKATAAEVIWSARKDLVTLVGKPWDFVPPAPSAAPGSKPGAAPPPPLARLEKEGDSIQGPLVQFIRGQENRLYAGPSGATAVVQTSRSPAGEAPAPVLPTLGKELTIHADRIHGYLSPEGGFKNAQAEGNVRMISEGKEGRGSLFKWDFIKSAGVLHGDPAAEIREIAAASLWGAIRSATAAKFDIDLSRNRIVGHGKSKVQIPAEAGPVGVKGHDLEAEATEFLEVNFTPATATAPAALKTLNGKGDVVIKTNEVTLKGNRTATQAELGITRVHGWPDGRPGIMDFTDGRHMEMSEFIFNHGSLNSAEPAAPEKPSPPKDAAPVKPPVEKAGPDTARPPAGKKPPEGQNPPEGQKPPSGAGPAPRPEEKPAQPPKKKDPPPKVEPPPAPYEGGM